MSIGEQSSKPAAAAATLRAKAAALLASLRGNRKRQLIAGGIGVAAVLFLFFVAPIFVRALFTISTDDAYVNGHVTFVAARVPGQVTKVFVDDNNRVRKGDVLVELDKQPYQIQVDLQKAVVATATSDLEVAKDEVRALVAQARANRFKLEHAIEQVNDQVAALRANVAALQTAEARQARAKADYDRAIDVSRTPGAISQQDVDLRKEAFRVAESGVKQALEQVYQIRVALGLPRDPGEGHELSEVPADLDQNFSAVREALAQLLQSAAPLGIVPKSYSAPPKDVIAEFYKRDPEGNLDRIYAKIIAEAPQIKLAQAKLMQAQSQLNQAELNLKWCDVVAEIDGVVTRRNVNPGNNVQAGQELMAVRSLTEIWIDANFKETQLADLRIGQHVELDVDMYGRREPFEGRISGFTMGTGSTLALLPPENATGNFVKIVQRLPVRIELVNYDPDKRPLFIGLSVVPHVYYWEKPTGPHAGDVLQPPDKLPVDQAALAPEAAPHRKTPTRHNNASMSSAAITPASVARPAINPWLVAAVVVIPTFMEVLDTTIANVALRYIAGGLSAAVVDSEWVLTSYLAANAVILPISGWISARLGRRNYFIMSIAVFTASSMLCGMAASLPQLILFRIMQGLAGGGLQPSSQAILLDAFPPEKQGGAMTMFGVAALIGPVVGPTLGGYLTDNYNWRWIFYINVPIGLIALAACHRWVRDPDYLVAKCAEMRRQPLNFDYLGLALLSLAMSCWEVMLSKGQQWDWLGDPFWRIQTLLTVFLVAGAWLIYRELRFSNPVVNFRPLTERNFLMSSIIIFCTFGVLYAATTSLPGLLQSLFGYDAYHSGLVMSPAGVFAICVMIVVARLLGWGADARWLVAAGLLVVAAANYWMSIMNLQISPWQVVWPRACMIMGLSLIFAPLNVAAYKYMPISLRGAAVGLFSLLRNEGGSVGTSMAQTLQERREQFHLLRLGEHLDPFDPNTRAFLQVVKAPFVRMTGDPVLAKQMALQTLANLRERQASSLAYFDVFWFLAVLALGLTLLVLFMKQSVAEKGTHLAAD